MTEYELNFKKIFEVLLQAQAFITLDTLSGHAGLSKRTVQNYIEKLDGWFAENALLNTRIERKRGYGVRLTTTSEERKTLERLILLQGLSLHSGDAKRRLDILRQLLFLEDEATIQGLVSRFYVSRATVVADLEWASSWLSQYKLRLFKTQRRGIEIIGGEIDRRNAIAGFFDACSYGTIQSFEKPRPLRRIDEKSLGSLVEVYAEDTVLKVARILEDAERAFDFILLDDFYTSLLTHMVISVFRIINGNYVSGEFLPPDETFSPLETKTAEYIAQRIKRVLHVSLPPAERAYICIHLVGYNAFRVDQDRGFSFYQKAERLAVGLVEAVDDKLNTRYFKDKTLFLGLYLHLKTAVYRLQVTGHAYKSRSLAPSADSIELYEAIREASRLYEQIFSVTADEEELISLCCFFLLSQRRNAIRLQALLVSNLDIISRMELIRDIELRLPKVRLVDSCSPQQLPEWPNSGFSFVISTEPLPHTDYPCVDLSKVPEKDYFAAIDAYIRKEILYRQGGNAC